MDREGHLRSVSDLIEKSHFHLNRQDRERVLAVFFLPESPGSRGGGTAGGPHMRPRAAAPRKEVRHRKEEKAWIRQAGELQEEAPPTQGDM